METTEKAVAVIDDDAAVRRSLELLLESAGFDVQTFESGEHYLKQGDGSLANCVIADLRMPGVSGLELVRRCKADRPALSVIVLTAHGDIEMAVEAMKLGAADFIEKPCEPQRMIDAVNHAISHPRDSGVDESVRAEVQRRIATLSPRERDVLRSLLTRGHNKSVAGDLGISVRTVEIHRSRILSKMKADGLSHLVRIMLSAGVSA